MMCDFSPALPVEKARLISPQQLAFIGDSVHALLARSRLMKVERRMNDMMRMYGMADMGMGEGEPLVLNAAHPLVKFVLDHKRSQSVPVICAQLYALARISQHPLTQEEMAAFMKRSNEIMMLLTK